MEKGKGTKCRGAWIVLQIRSLFAGGLSFALIGEATILF
jgi:hypothetical protein